MGKDVGMVDGGQKGRMPANRAVLAAFIAVQIGIPLASYIVRLATGDLSIPWGWQMHS